MRNQRGQSTAEYAIVVSVIIAAVVGMQLYTKRGMQGKIRDMSDGMIHASTGVGTADTILLPGEDKEQYEPYYNAETRDAKGVETTVLSQHDETHKLGGQLEKLAVKEESHRSGKQYQGSDLATDDVWNK